MSAKPVQVLLRRCKSSDGKSLAFRSLKADKCVNIHAYFLFLKPISLRKRKLMHCYYNHALRCVKCARQHFPNVCTKRPDQGSHMCRLPGKTFLYFKGYSCIKSFNAITSSRLTDSLPNTSITTIFCSIGQPPTTVYMTQLRTTNTVLEELLSKLFNVPSYRLMFSNPSDNINYISSHILFPLVISSSLTIQPLHYFIYNKTLASKKNLRFRLNNF